MRKDKKMGGLAGLVTVLCHISVNFSQFYTESVDVQKYVI